MSRQSYNSLFLDFDGVITAKKNGDSRFDSESLCLVSEYVASYALKTVLSTSWRKDYSIDDIKFMLSKDGATDEMVKSIIGATPIIEEHHTRGDSIQSYLSEHAVSAYVIFDDYPPNAFSREMRNKHLVQICKADRVSVEYIERAERIIESQGVKRLLQL